ncbi:SoxR reducing system RseC family protein [Sinanaerobacter chloroacetimidivorans]|jgi:sigma-E factor negative regulatory protein RseC|uniref:SoxR reducing system RseC family protein n=1 Tax=Sinanaerobacter chloroacetimidivorans TaxID=2818044 RepID=A0A8J7W142_9FIRM|nr:SoxR reducing system RseC family protein [Sinanaerobacter chloroacetimidivorans]MBR0598887.1 SoxR reducing system RseC family protein [Sinanaerobacter chloroacetimidivorans]
MRKTADVLEVLDDNTAKIMLYKHKKCHGCGSCNKHLHPGSIFQAENEIHARQGDMVDVKVTKAFSITEFLIVYILPTLSFFAGLFLGAFIFDGKNEGAISVGLAFILLIGAIIINVIYRKSYQPRYSVSILKRIQPAEPRLK